MAKVLAMVFECLGEKETRCPFIVNAVVKPVCQVSHSTSLSWTNSLYNAVKDWFLADFLTGHHGWLCLPTSPEIILISRSKRRHQAMHDSFKQQSWYAHQPTVPGVLLYQETRVDQRWWRQGHWHCRNHQLRSRGLGRRCLCSTARYCNV